MNKLTAIIAAILLMVIANDAYKILVVFPIPGKSHSILGYGIVKHLLKAGHEVTYITPFVEKDGNPNLTQVYVRNDFDPASENMLNLKYLIENEITMDISVILSLILNVHVIALEDENVQKLMNSPEVKFDVVLAEWLSTEMGAVYATVFDAPLVWVSTTDQHSWILRLIDEHLHPAYSVGFVSTNVTPFTFLQRVEELISELFIMYHYYMYGDVQQIAIYDRLVAPILTKKGKRVPTFDEIRYNASMVLGNAHVSMGEATRLPQNYKPIGGYHIDGDVKPLAEDLQNIMDNARNGVIYFSMGSNLKSKDWPDEIKSGLLKVFGGLKQTVLWKFEEDFPDVPKNVHILKWAPQYSILTHPNCIVFITHGGLLSITEAIHFGVPIIGVPVFGDQFANVKRAVNKGFAKEVAFSHNIAADLQNSMRDIISDPKYMNKVKELSLIYHDRPVRPSVELVHWVEHVAKTRGAPHLRSPALMTPWYQKLYLDLAAVVLVTLYAILKSAKLLFTTIYTNKTNNEFKKKD